MSIFVIIPTQASTALLSEKIKSLGLSSFKLPEGEILVAFTGTTKALSDTIGISDGSVGNAIVVSVSSYYGRTTPDTWEWMTKNWGG